MVWVCLILYILGLFTWFTAMCILERGSMFYHTELFSRVVISILWPIMLPILIISIPFILISIYIEDL